MILSLYFAIKIRPPKTQWDRSLINIKLQNFNIFSKFNNNSFRKRSPGVPPVPSSPSSHLSLLSRSGAVPLQSSAPAQYLNTVSAPHPSINPPHNPYTFWTCFSVARIVLHTVCHLFICHFVHFSLFLSFYHLTSPGLYGCKTLGSRWLCVVMVVIV